MFTNVATRKAQKLGEEGAAPKEAETSTATAADTTGVASVVEQPSEDQIDESGKPAPEGAKT